MDLSLETFGIIMGLVSGGLGFGIVRLIQSLSRLCSEVSQLRKEMDTATDKADKEHASLHTRITDLASHVHHIEGQLAAQKQ